MSPLLTNRDMTQDEVIQPKYRIIVSDVHRLQAVRLTGHCSPVAKKLTERLHSTQEEDRLSEVLLIHFHFVCMPHTRRGRYRQVCAARWVLRTKPRCSVRVKSPFDCRAVSPAPTLVLEHLKVTQRANMNVCHAI